MGDPKGTTQLRASALRWSATAPGTGANLDGKGRRALCPFLCYLEPKNLRFSRLLGDHG